MEEITTTIFNKAEDVAALVDGLVNLHERGTQSQPLMYIDLKGIDLCREGSLSIFTLLMDNGNDMQHVFLIDIHAMGGQAFETAGARNETLRDVLENKKIKKVFFDVRNDSDILFAQYGVALRGVEDVQLMESATRRTTDSRQYMSGLDKCIENTNIMSYANKEMASWKQAKEKREQLFLARYGGFHDVSDQHPLPKDIIAYCVRDVQYLPKLRKKFAKGKTAQWRKLVNNKARERIMLSQSSEYQPKGPNRAMAPWTKEENDILDAWSYGPTIGGLLKSYKSLALGR